MFLRNLYQKYNDDKNVLYITLILEFMQDYYLGEEKISTKKECTAIHS